MLGIGVEQPPNHSLILGVVFLRLDLEKIDATLAQRNSDLDPFVLKNKILRTGKKVSDDPGVSDRFVRIFYFRAHKFVCPFANSLHQICEYIVAICKAHREDAFANPAKAEMPFFNGTVRLIFRDNSTAVCKGDLCLSKGHAMLNLILAIFSGIPLGTELWSCESLAQIWVNSHISIWNSERLLGDL